MRVEGDPAAGYRLKGDMTYGTVPAAFERALKFAERTRMDLSGVKRVDSAGLALLVEWACTARRQNKTLVLAHVPDSLRSLIAAGGLQQVLPVEGG